MTIDQLTLGNVASLAAVVAAPAPASRVSVPAPNPARPPNDQSAQGRTGTGSTEEQPQPEKKAAPQPTEPRVGGKFHRLDGRRLSILHDDAADRYVYRGINTQTKEVERQYPSEEDLARVAYMRSIAGQVLDQLT